MKIKSARVCKLDKYFLIVMYYLCLVHHKIYVNLDYLVVKHA